MQISIPFCYKFDEKGVTAMLPGNYWAEPLLPDGSGVRKFLVCPDSSRDVVGSVEIGDGLLVFKFYTETKAENDYVSAFGRAHPDYNPKKIFWGIVYSVEQGKYQLNKEPCDLFGQAFEEAQLVGNSNSYLVMFYRGDWTLDRLTVVSMQKILPGGQLLMNMGPTTLELGNLENENTM